MNRIKLFLILVLVAVFNFNTTAQNAGDNDPTFNPTDIGFGFGDGTSSNSVLATAIQPDGKILIGGNFTSYNSIARKSIARINTDGTIDSTFNPGTGVSTDVRTIAIQSDGKIIIGGAISTYNGVTVGNIARLNTDGSLDTSFNTGTGANNNVSVISIQGDGKILVGGGFTSFNGTNVNYLVRLNINGSIDATFNQGTGFDQVAFNSVESIFIQPDGKIIIGGKFASYNGTARGCVVRLNTNGIIDASFNPGSGANSHILTISLQSDGKIIIGGNFFSYNGVTRYGLARLNTNGSLDATFDPGSGALAIYTSAIQTDGKILIGGGFTTYNGSIVNYITRVNTDGSIDATFNTGIGSNYTVEMLTIQPDGRIIIGGLFKFYNEISKNYITRINIDGSLDVTFNTGSGVNGVVNSMVIQPDGKIIIGGSFTTYNGITSNRIVRLNSDGSIDNAFNTGTGLGITANILVSSIAIQPDGKIIIGGSFTTYNGITSNRIVRLNSEGSIDNTFNIGSGAFGQIQKISIQSDGKIIIAGDFTNYNGVTRSRIARLNSDGSLDGVFDPGTGANNGIWSTSIQPDGKIIIGGNFSSYNGTPINCLARLNSDGSLDTSFNPGSGANLIIFTSEIQPDGKIVIGGMFNDYNGTPINNLARLNSDGSLDTSFNVGSGANSDIRSIITQNDGKILIGGNFTSYNGVLMNSLARLNNDGSLDITFNPSTGASYGIASIVLQNDGKIIIGGSFTSYNGVGRNRVARIMNNTITGIENINNQKVFNIYPNPTTTDFIIELAEFSPTTKINIVSVEGKIVYTNNTINTNKIVVNAANWSNGVYMVKITDKQSSNVVKLIKQ